MPIGDAGKIHEHCGDLVRAARDAREKDISIRVGDVRDALGLRHDDAAIDICQVLETITFRANNRVRFIRKARPNQGMDTVYRFKLLGK